MPSCSSCAGELPAGRTDCPRCAPLGAPAPDVAWYYRTGSLLTAFIVGGPLVLPLIWGHPTLTPQRKKLYTALVLGITAAIVAASAGTLYWAYRQLSALGVL